MKKERKTKKTKPIMDESALNLNVVKAQNKLVGLVENNDLYCSDDGVVNKDGI